MSPTNSGPAAATPLAATSPGSQTGAIGTASSITLAATGGTAPYTWQATGLPAGLSVSGSTIEGTPSAAGTFTVTATVTDSASPAATAQATFTLTVSDPNDVKTIAQIQGTGARSSYAPANNATSSSPANGQTVTTEGVITALYTKGFASSGAANCGFCGFYLQTGGTGGGTDSTPGASDAIFVYGNPGFTGKNSTGGDLAVGQSVRVTGTISEFASATDPSTEATTELTASSADKIVAITALDPVTPQTTLPTTYAGREAHEGELFAPTDLVITDTYNFELYGELGLATGGTPLVQPTEKCVASNTACITDAQKDIKDRGWFLEDGTSTGFLSGSTLYRPKNSNNSDIPLPFIDKTHSARVGATLTFPTGKGGVLDFRNKKWYLQPQRAVSSTHGGDPDLGTDVVTIEDTRTDNAAPRNVGGDLKIATYNVENFFNITGKAFADANPFYTCEWDYDRDDNPTLTYQCTSPQAIPSAWDPVTGAPTGYKSGVVSAPRGAARAEDLARQTAKIVKAINGLDADVVSLEELGNVNKLRMGVTNGPLSPDPDKADQGLGTPIAWRDSSINYLVDHLNDAAGAGTWAFVASPQESTDATSVAGMCAKTQPNGQPVDGPASTAGTCSWASGQDVIRSGFLYKKATVVPVGESDLDLPGSSAPTPSPFDNAREPLAQFFKPVGHPNSDGFAVIVNHFKSKGDSDPKATGDNANSDLVGAFNGDRKRQANELLRFANEFAAKWDTDKVFLVGDFNAYTGEDPTQTILNDPNGIDGLDFGLVTSTDPDDLTYVFTATVDGIGYGGAGSLDHVFASAAARADITGTDVWEINSNEPSVYNYSRYNTNKTDFWDGTKPFGGSDHNPEIIGIDVPDSGTVKDVQIIGSNDFHGRLLGSSSDGGAAQLAGAVKSLKSVYGAENSIFVAAGDLIGASTFESFVQKDKPTLEALNAAGLEVSAVGNHEFDQGYEDLINRVMKPYDATSNPYGAQGGLTWDYIGSNVVYHADPDGDGPKKAGDPIVLPTATRTINGVKIGFVGAVTEDLMGLVNPAGMTNIDVKPIVSTVNGYADQLKGDGAKLVVLLLHEGAPSTDCSTMKSDGSSFATVINGINDNVDAVISGHTHLEYSCQFPVAGWSARAITKRPVMSAGQYGVALDQLVYSFDADGNPVDVVANNVGVKGPGSTLFTYPEDPVVKAIVDDAVAAAEGPGGRVLGKISGPFNRARLADATTENRGGESTLGNLVAEIQRWATPAAPGIKPADIAFMNPGGLRADLKGTGADTARDVTYKEAAGVQPFANTLVNVDMTGAQIRTVLEQQWQRDDKGNVPSRPFLRLGTSKGFTYTYYETNDADHPGAKLGHVTGMWLNGTPVKDDVSYSVTMNSFLASGGDNFREFAHGADKRDTGITDLQAQVDYMAGNAQQAPLAVDYAQHAVGVTFPGAAPSSYQPGDHVTFDVSSWAMTATGDKQDTALEVKLGSQSLGTFTVNNAASGSPNDDAGKASVDVVLPAGVNNGKQSLKLVGATTGTQVPVTIQVAGGVTDIQILATNDFHGRIQRSPSSAEAGAAVLSGAVKQLRAANPNTVFAAAGDLIGASTFESFIQNDKPTIDALNAAGLEVSAVGNHELDKGYDDLVDRVMAEYDAEDNPQGGAEWQYIAANLKVKATGDDAVPATWIKTMDGVQVGFVGAVTEDLPSLVSPAGIADLEVTDIVDSVNAEAEDLKDEGADVVVMLVHEGSPTTACNTMTDPGTTWGHIVTSISPDVNAIVSGHTHLAYNCSFPVAGWSGREVTERPVVSAGQYGYNLNQLDFQVDSTSGEVVGLQQNLIALQSCTAGCTTSTQTWTANFPADPAVTSIVSTAVTQADVLGARKLGQVGGAFNRAKLADGTTENRGGESTLGNLVAEVQRWATESPESGEAQIAFMNPGGLRADMAGSGTGAYPRDLTYKQAAVVQPFANTLVNMDLTGANIKLVLEQQWQRDSGGAIPSRPFLRLGISKGFTYTYDPSKPEGSRITGMWLNGDPIAPSATYSVTVNSFLASGGDNFRGFNNGTNKRDTGKVDLQAMVDYMGEFSPVPVDYSQRSVGVKFPAAAPETYVAGDHVRFDLSSLAMSTAADTKDTQVAVAIGDTTLGTFAVTNTIGTDVFDEYGVASVDVTVPSGTPVGTRTLWVTGNNTGTRIPVTIRVVAPTPPPTTPTTTAATAAPMTWGTDGSVHVTVTPATASGLVTVSAGGTTLGTGAVTNGIAAVTIDGKALEPGTHTLTVAYAGNATHDPSQATVTLVVAKADTTLTATAEAVDFGAAATVSVTATPTSATGAVTVSEGGRQVGTGTLSAGSASITISGGSLEPGSHSLTVSYAGDARHAAATAATTLQVRKVSSTTSAAVSPDRLPVGSGKASITVTVDAGAVPATGQVVALLNGEQLDRGQLVDGRVVLRVGPFDQAGVKAIQIRYAGDDHVDASATSTSFRVTKAEATVTADYSPDVVKAGKTRATVSVRVKAKGLTPGGWVEVKAPGQAAVRVRLDDGRASVRLAAFGSVGKKTVSISYEGNDRVASATTDLVIRVVKK